MSHKNAPPLTQAQQGFESWWRARYQDRGTTIAFGRDKNGQYLAEFARDVWAAWQVAAQNVEDLKQRIALLESERTDGML